MKLRNKLILSCAALAAVATTAVSTTFAWYTSNQEVTADQIEASTASNADALLLISKTGAANSWSSNVHLGINATLSPVFRDADGAMHLWDATTNATASGAAPTGAYISFSLYFKSGNGNNLKVAYKEFDLVNTTTGDLPTKSVLTNEGLPAAQTDDGEYSVDFIKAITMENTFGLAVEGDAATTEQAYTDTDATGTAAFKFDNFATRSDTVGNAAVNAHTYYNDVKKLNYKRAESFVQATATANGYYVKTGDVYEVADIDAFAANTTYYTLSSGKYNTVAADATFDEDETYYTYTPADYVVAATQPTSTTFADGIYYTVASIANTYDGSVEYRTREEQTPSVRTSVTSKGANAAAFNAAAYTINADSILRVDYLIYLDGWDFQCFDACQGQTLSLAMTFRAIE